MVLIAVLECRPDLSSDRIILESPRKSCPEFHSVVASNKPIFKCSHSLIVT